jgi:hypothetical protein
MGYLLFWIEATVASVLWVALGQALAWRVRRRWWRGWVKFLVWLLVLAPWAAIVAMFCLIEYFFVGGATEPLISAIVAGSAFLAAGLALWWRGRARSTIDPPVRRAALWRLGRLAVALAVALVLSATTCWNLDLAVRQEMTALRSEIGASAVALSPPAVPDAMNAAVLYQQAIDLLNASPTPSTASAQGEAGRKWGNRVANWLSPEAGPFDPRDPQMRQFLQGSQGIIGLLREAGQRPGFNAGVSYNPPLFNIPLPDLASYKDLARLLCLDARVKAADGRCVEAMDDLSAAFALSAKLSSEPTLVTCLVSASMDSLAVRTFQETLGDWVPSKESLERLAIPPDPLAAALHRSFQMERLTGLSFFAFPDVVPRIQYGPDHDQYGCRPGMTYVCAEAGWRVFLWRQDMASYSRSMSKVAKRAGEPYYKARQQWEQATRRLEQKPRAFGLMTSILLPSLNKAALIAAAAQARHRQAELAKAMWLYRLDEGRFPSELSQLVPPYLPAVPVDPFTGQAMKLKAADDGSLIVYSFGEDLDDDGGREWKPSGKAGPGPRDGDVAFVVYRAPAATAPATGLLRTNPAAAAEAAE